MRRKQDESDGEASIFEVFRSGQSSPLWRAMTLSHRAIRALRATIFAWLCLLSIITASWFLAPVAAENTTSPTPTPTLSGCQVCAMTQDCSHAYISSPGQFCGDWLDQASQRQSCCCPRDATCKRTTYSCKCSLISTSTNSDVSTYGWVGIAIGGVAFLSCCVGCCWFGSTVAKKAARQRAPPPPVTGALVAAMAMPVPGGAACVPAYNITPAPVAYAAAAPPVYDYGYGGGGFSSALTTGLGFGAGMMTVNALGDDHGHFGGGFDGGDGGFGGGGDGGFDGGGDGGGDFSGDF